MSPTPTHSLIPPLSTSLGRMVQWLPRLDLRGHDSHPKSIVYFRVHPWCCIFYGSGQMCDDISIVVISYTVFFVALKILCALPFHLYQFSTQLPSTTDFFKIFCSVVFSRRSRSWKKSIRTISAVCAFNWTFYIIPFPFFTYQLYFSLYFWKWLP